MLEIKDLIDVLETPIKSDSDKKHYRYVEYKFSFKTL